MLKIWRFFCSLKLAVWCGFILSALLGISSIYLIRQPGLDTLGTPPLFVWLKDQNNIFSLWWLLALIALSAVFTINTVCCTIEALRKLIPELLRSKKLTASGNNNNANSNKKRIHLLAPHVAHIGLVILLVAHLISSLWGFKIPQLMLDEKWRQIPQANLKLRLLNNHIEINKQGEVNSFSLPEFNKPILYDGLAVYFGQKSDKVGSINLKIKSPDKNNKIINLTQGEKYQINPQMSLKVKVIVPDYRVGSSNQQYTQGEYRNPAAYIELYENEHFVTGNWMFIYYPGFSQVAYKNIKVTLDSAKWYPALSVGIAKNPGAITALIGGLILLIGLLWYLTIIPI